MTQIENFQRKNGLVADSVLGPNTLKAMKNSFRITSNEKAAHFIGQMAHESGNFTKSKEGLNYSVEGLINGFGRHRISLEDCKKYGRIDGKQKANQVAIGNTVYGGEWGKKNLGNIKPMDGYNLRGHGPLHLTGRRNFEAFARFVNDPAVVDNPDLILTKYYFESALFYFDSNNVWRYCDKVNNASILTVSRAVNLGNANSPHTPNHLEDRIVKTLRFYEYLNRK